MNTQNLQLILILASLIIGMISAIYFYQSTEIFVETLQKPLKLISSGMIVISFGILLAVFIFFQQDQGNKILLFGVPIYALFYILYIIGSALIFMGAKQFTRKPIH